MSTDDNVAQGSAGQGSAFSRVGVIGAGAFGTALAHMLAADHSVRLWSRGDAVAADIATRRMNARYLPGQVLDDKLAVTTDLGEAVDADVVLLVTPAQSTRAMAGRLAPLIRPGVPVVLCAKGIEQASGLVLSAVMAQVVPGAPLAVLSGPGFAAEIARRLPTAVTLASADADLGAALALALSTRTFRVYWTDDVVGVELGGAMKNVLAIAAGIADGKALGAGAHAALVTRGFAEMRRLGLALGAKAETLVGLSGLGDLVLTCGSAQSRNMSLGRALGQGQALADILAQRNSVTEGIATAAALAALATTHGLELPIVAQVHAICTGATTPDAALAALLSRPPKAED